MPATVSVVTYFVCYVIFTCQINSLRRYI